MTPDSKKERTLTEKINDVAARRAIFFPTAEIYGGVAGFYDWGPVGSLLRRKVIDAWREIFVKSEDNVHEIEGSTILPYNVLKASGHVDHFTDPKVECTKCKKVFRADHLIEEVTGRNVEGVPFDAMTEIIRKEKVKCPKCGGDLSDVKPFQLMFGVGIGAEANQGFLRPETAQNIFTAFKRVFPTMRGTLPFGIAQVGRVFRNEISPRQGVIRVREFTQMEIEMFVDQRQLNNHPRFDEVKNIHIRILPREAQKQNKEPGGDGEVVEVTAQEAVNRKLVPNQYIAYFIVKETLLFTTLGIPFERLRFRYMMPEETPHYSGGNIDAEVELSMGWKEIIGNAYRTDYDLKSHGKTSGEDLSVMLPDEKDRIIPHVIEPSIGVERITYCVLEHCFREGDRDWTWFQFPLKIAPIHTIVVPLMRKDKLPEKAKEIYRALKIDGLDVTYDEKGSVGKIYARADEIGIPFAVTVDYTTLEDNTVTIRDRDSAKQVRASAEELPSTIRKLISGKITFQEAGGAIKN
ncbi:MAG: glycine--tRNA ligase [Candidatus Atabeyarchaeum deiterrae]